VGPHLFVAAALEGLAELWATPEQAELAVRLLAGAAALREQMGTPVRPVDQARLTNTLTTARSILGVDAFAAVWAEAQTLPLEQIISNVPSAAPFDALGDRSER
jgi:hypothetical protein